MSKPHPSQLNPSHLTALAFVAAIARNDGDTMLRIMQQTEDTGTLALHCATLAASLAPDAVWQKQLDDFAAWMTDPDTLDD